MDLQKVVHQLMNATFCVIKDLIRSSSQISQISQNSQSSQFFKLSLLFS